MQKYKINNNYYRKYLKRLIMSQYVHTKIIQNISKIMLSIEERVQLVHLLYMFLLSNGQKSHIVKFNVPKKYKKQYERVKGFSTSYCRVLKSNIWLVLKGWLRGYKYQRRESKKGFALKTKYMRITRHRTNRTRIGKILRGIYKGYPYTPVTMHILFQNSNYEIKWWTLNLLKLIKTKLKGFDEFYRFFGKNWTVQEVAIPQNLDEFEIKEFEKVIKNELWL